MKRFLVLAYGYVTPTDEINQAWGAWFGATGPHLVDPGGPFNGGVEITRAGRTSLGLDATSLTGYCVISAESLEAAEALVKDMPYVDSVRVYDIDVM